MSEYYPDGWILCEIRGEKETFYKVFGSWRGGFAQGDSWRMNSGVTKCEKQGKVYKFSGHSGSAYYCHEDGYGRLGAYNHGVLSDYEHRSEGMLSAIPFLPDGLTEMQWSKPHDQASSAV